MENKKVRSVVQYENHFSEFLKNNLLKFKIKYLKLLRRLKLLNGFPRTI